MGNSNPTTPRNDDGRKKRCSCYGFFSSSAARLILPPVILILRCQSLYPLFFTATVCSPVLRSSEEGVLPAKAPSISMSAPAGVEDTASLAASSGARICICAAGAATAAAAGTALGAPGGTAQPF